MARGEKEDKITLVEGAVSLVSGHCFAVDFTSSCSVHRGIMHGYTGVIFARKQVALGELVADILSTE